MAAQWWWRRRILRQSSLPAVNSLRTRLGAISFRVKLRGCTRRSSILTGCRRCLCRRLKNFSALETDTARCRGLMDQIKVLVLSSVVPNAFGSGGELVLHQHLKVNPKIESQVMRWEGFPLRLRLIGKLRELGFPSVSQMCECMFPVLPSGKIIADQIDCFRPHVLVTVAHGWWHIQARRIARQFKLPLVCFFQDWWPDFPEIPVAFRARVEHEFRKTCAGSNVAICVSRYMRRELGDPGNALVLHDTPSLPQSRLPA